MDDYTPLIRTPLTAANGMHDLDRIAGPDHMPVKGAARDDLAIDLQCQALAGKTQRIQQVGRAGLGWYFSCRTVEYDIHGASGLILTGTFYRNRQDRVLC